MDGRPEVCLSALPRPSLSLRMAFLAQGLRAAGVATACWGLDYAVACTTILIAGHGADLTRRSGVVARGHNALANIEGMPDNDIDKAGTCLSHELCSSVKHPPKHMQRPRQHADAGFRGGSLVRGI
jgi:hypothetical protein